MNKYKEIKWFKLFGFLPFLLFTLIFISPACDDDNVDDTDDPSTETPSVSAPDTIKPEDIDVSMIYQPNDLSNQNWYVSNSQFYYGRSKQSDHFIVMWEEGFGLDPNADTVPSTYRFDVDALLEVAEASYKEYVDVLDFADVGVGASNLDNYKMMIMVYYTTDWTSYGSGYDNVIGAIWQNPATMQPPGSTIAHEVGHAFQYQTCCDLLVYGGLTDYTTCGFRYGQGAEDSRDNGGNSFWEQCAQWQSYQLYPDQAFSSYNFDVHMANYHRHFCHEWQRYASYFLHYYWADKRGDDMLGKIWRESEYPEDPIETYMRLYDLTVDEFNDEMYDAAAHLASFDIDAIREIGADYIGEYAYGFCELNDGSYQVSYSNCPQTTGYNVVPLNVPDAGTEIGVTFTGLAPGSSLATSDPGQYTDGDDTKTTLKYNTEGSVFYGGWRYGYVALLNDGSRQYGDMNKVIFTSNAVDSAKFTVPANCNRLWLVVLGAPTVYERLPWDEDESSDPQWPYKIKLNNTDLLGNFSIPEGTVPSNLTLTYDVSFAADASAYSGTTVNIVDNGDIVDVGYALAMKKSDINNSMLDVGVEPTEGKIAFSAVQSDNSYSYNTTANGYGFWFDGNGDVVAYSGDSQVYIEYDDSSFEFTIGQYPGKSSVGDTYTAKIGFVYTLEGTEYLVTFVFNITITA